MEINPVAALAMLVTLKNLFKAEVVPPLISPVLLCVQSWNWILFLSYLPPVIRDNE